MNLIAENVHHQFGAFVALKEANLNVAAGSFVALLGPSGSGKTTLLRIIAGLIQPTGGRILIDGEDISALPPNKRNMGIVFQNYALFPHLTAFENVAFPLQMRRLPRQVIKTRVEEALSLIELGKLAGRYPAQLSGGQQQRIALARAIVFQPAVLLMDEPLGSLDRQLRERMQIEVHRLQRELGITTIYVTHDQQEAFAMADIIAVMRDGEILQSGTPRNIYHSPKDLFTAEFVGYLNSFSGQLSISTPGKGYIHTKDGMDIPVQVTRNYSKGFEAHCGVRPEKVRIGTEARNMDFCVEGKLGVMTFQGTFYWLEIDLPNNRRLAAQVFELQAELKEGNPILAGWNMEDTLFFDNNGAVAKQPTLDNC